MDLLLGFATIGLGVRVLLTGEARYAIGTRAGDGRLVLEALVAATPLALIGAVCATASHPDTSWLMVALSRWGTYGFLLSVGLASPKPGPSGWHQLRVWRDRRARRRYVLDPAELDDTVLLPCGDELCEWAPLGVGAR